MHADARLIVHQTDYLRAAAMLDRREVSVAVGYLDDLPAAAKRRKVSEADYCMVLSADLAAPQTLSDYCAREHVLVTFAGDLVGYVDETLEALGAARRIALSVSNFSVVPYLLRGSSRLATVPGHLASVLGGEPGLRTAPLPFESPRFDVSIGWHPTADSDPGEKLLRSLVVRAAGGRPGPSPSR